MKGTGMATKLYGAAGLVSLAGMGMVLSVIFAGPGLVLLLVGSLLLLGGLVRDLVRVAGATEKGPAREERPLEAAKAQR